jgi:hypothetical protein
MLYQQILYELAIRDLTLVSEQFAYYAMIIILPSAFAGVIVRRITLGRIANWDCFRRCWFASFVAFLVMMVVALAVNWWELKQSYYRVEWFLTTLLVGFLAPLVTEILHCRRPARPAEETTPRRRWRFTLRSVVMVQLILIVAGGLWMSGLREEIATLMEDRRVALELHSRQTACEQRFGPHGWIPTLVFMGDSYELRLRGDLRRPAEALAAIEPTDNLGFLELRSANLTDADLQRIGQFTALRRLYVAGSPLGSGLREFRNLHELEELGMSVPSIDSDALSAIAQLPKLKVLWIDCDQFGDDHLAAICQSTALKSLTVHSKAITDLALAAIEGNQSLEFLHINKSQITQAAAAQLQSKRPKLVGLWNQVQYPED